jgi:hypothetical protein
VTRPDPDAPPPLVLGDRVETSAGCQWIEGDLRVAGWRFCGAPTTVPGGSWCAEHRARVFDPVKTAESDTRQHQRVLDRIRSR